MEVKADKLAKYKTSLEEYDKFLKRLRHIAAVFLNHSVKEEPRIFIDAQSPKYEESTGLIRFTGQLRRYVESGVELNISCPFSFVDNASDDELANWIETILKENGNDRPDDR